MVVVVEVVVVGGMQTHPLHGSENEYETTTCPPNTDVTAEHVVPLHVLPAPQSLFPSAFLVPLKQGTVAV